MDMNKVEICGVNTAKLPVLPNAKMRELLARIKEGDQKAREEMVQGNLRLVLSVIQRFNNRGEYVDDLFQVGCIGLMKAIDNFDLSQNVKFSTYAVPMIIGEIRRYLRDNNPIRVSRSLRDIAYKALQTRDVLANRYSQEPSIAQIAEELQIPREEIVFALDAIQEPISLFEPIYNDGGDPIYVLDQISDEKNTERRLIEGVSIKEGMENLGERERLILTMRFYEGRTQMEVAEEIGISQAQVSRLEKAALRHLRKYMATS
ncbi:MAG: RNA polymerase sporulation sigma factor SigG [Firmicutes bacterium]|nr:RNA polymerase sporulation sigma factor SigG [Bacillota bacterium]